MCGICGIALSERSTRVLDDSLIARMRDVLQHRGPDGAGLYMNGRTALGHRRLSIVDVAGGHQPMSSDDERFHIVYNGEVYNHGDIRSDLTGHGHVYRTRCDTESVLRLYQEERHRSVERLRGMFAFGIWDARERELFLARDRLGVKPLYYVHAADGSLYFASEIKALIVAGAVSPRLNLEALPDYLANHAASGADTLVDGVRRLPPGHTLTWRDGEIRIAQYWDPPVADESANDTRTDKSLIAEFGERFSDAVRVRLMADVPLGVFLSGGIDSAAITAAMSQLMSEPVRTFSVAFQERSANELGYARMVAEKFGTEHHETIVEPTQFFDALPRLIWHEDEPLAHPSSIPLHFVARLAAEHVKVVLTGEGSDEALGGYARYWKTLLNLRAGHAWERLVPNPARRAAAGAIGAMAERFPFARKLQRTFLTQRADLVPLYFDNFAVFSGARQAQLLSADMRATLRDVDPYEHVRRHFDRAAGGSLLGRLLYSDQKTYLHELLMKQDQMSMAASLESRVPFLDHWLMEFAARLPDRMKIRGLTTKHILRESMRGVLPAPILERGKMGFPVPFGEWVRGDHRWVLDEFVLSQQVADRGIFDMQYVRTITRDHVERRADHSERLWSLLNFELWHRTVLEGTGDGAPSETAAMAAGVGSV